MTDSTTTLIVAPTLAPDAISATAAALQQRDELLARARRGKNALKTMPEGQKLPGVRHWREAKAIVR